jgi:hypothetical protein
VNDGALNFQKLMSSRWCTLQVVNETTPAKLCAGGVKHFLRGRAQRVEILFFGGTAARRALLDEELGPHMPIIFLAAFTSEYSPES